jgi:hypothetical protein
MTQNPYAQFGHGDGVSPYGPDFGDQPQPRTSILAIVALVVSIIACLPFCIPGPGALAMILGGIALMIVTFSKGRVRGVGLCATAICLGLLQTVLSMVLLLGVYQPVTGFIGTAWVGPASRVMTAAEAGDTQKVMGELSPRARAAVTEEMITDFVSRYRNEVGKFQSAPDGPIDIVNTFSKLGPAMQGINSLSRPGRAQGFIPVAGHFAGGPQVIVVQIDVTAIDHQQQQSIKPPPMLNIGILTNDGKQIWLLPPDDAEALPPVDSSGNPKSKGQSSLDDAPPDAGKIPGASPKP